MKKTVITMSICLISLVLLIIIKDQYSSVLLKKANFGMPALMERGEIDYLFIGSSVFRQGLDIDVLEKENPGTSYILTYNGNQPVFEYMQLKKLLDSGVEIRNLYVDMYAYTLCREPGLDDEKLLMELTLPEKMELYLMLSNKSFTLFWETFISANNEQIITWPLNMRILNSQFRNGGTLSYSDGLSDTEYADIQPINSNGTINDVQLDALRQIFSICEKNNVSITFVETPKAKNIMQSENYKNIMTNYESFLNENSIPLIRYNGESNSADEYVDGIHLSSKGRETFSKWLVNQMLP